jgi:Flp pilus assembly protein TadD
MRTWVLLVVAGGLLACGQGTPEDMAGNLLTAKDPYAFHRAMCYTLLRTNQHAKVVAHARRLIEARPEEAEGHYLLGRALLGMELYREAKQELERAIKLDSKLAAAHAMLGVLLDTRGKHAQAEKSHRRAVSLNGKSASYHNNLGFCLYLQGRYGQAVKIFRVALKHRPGCRRVHNNLGFALARAGQLDEALKNFKVAGDEAHAYNNLGLAHELRGETEQAFNYYLRAHVMGDVPRVKHNLERVCKKLGRPVPRVLTTKKAELTREVSEKTEKTGGEPAQPNPTEPQRKGATP